MKFQFENLPDFIAMDGHGFYVWAAVIVAALISAWLIISPLIRLPAGDKRHSSRSRYRKHT
jgi:heme exporter protein D